MSQDEQDLIIGRATRELKTLQREMSALRLEIQRIALIIENVGKRLQGLNIVGGLTEDEIAALDAARLTTLLSEYKATWQRISALEKELEGIS